MCVDFFKFHIFNVMLFIAELIHQQKPKCEPNLVTLGVIRLYFVSVINFFQVEVFCEGLQQIVANEFLDKSYPNCTKNRRHEIADNLCEIHSKC